MASRALIYRKTHMKTLCLGWCGLCLCSGAENLSAQVRENVGVEMLWCRCAMRRQTYIWLQIAFRPDARLTSVKHVYDRPIPQTEYDVLSLVNVGRPTKNSLVHARDEDASVSSRRQPYSWLQIASHPSATLISGHACASSAGVACLSKNVSSPGRKPWHRYLVYDSLHSSLRKGPAVRSRWPRSLRSLCLFRFLAAVLLKVPSRTKACSKASNGLIWIGFAMTW